MSPELIPLDDIKRQVSDLKGALAAQNSGGFPFGVALIADVRVNAVADQVGYSEQYDSTSIAGDPYDAMSHEEIYNKAQSLAPSDIESAANNWRMLGYNAADDTADFAVQIGNVIGTHWQGPAATAAGEGVVRYANAALELVMASHSLGAKVLQSRDGVSDARANVPAPESFTAWDSAVDALSTRLRDLSFGMMKSRQHARDEAEELARTVMKTYYDPVIRDAAAQIPVLPQALNPLNGGASFQSPLSIPGWSGGPSGSEPFSFTPTGGTGGPPAGGPTDSGSPTDPTAGANPQTSSTQATTTQTAGYTPTETTGSPQPPSGNPGTSSPPTSTSSAPGGSGTPGGAMAGPGAGSPGGSANRSSSRFGGGNGGSGNSGGGGRFGDVGSGGGAGSGAGSGGGRFGGTDSSGGRFGGGSSSLGGPSGGGGGSSQGASGGGAPGASGGSGGSSAAGRAGAPGMGGMSPGGGRGGGGGGDDVHNTPSYLIDAVNGDELIGTLPLVAPPVLGE